MRESAAGRSSYAGETYYFCSPSCQAKFDADPAKFVDWKSAGAHRTSRVGREFPGAGISPRGDLHLPDAPGDRARSTGRLPDLRNGPGAQDDFGGFHRGQFRTDRHDPPVLDRSGADLAGLSPGHVSSRSRCAFVALGRRARAGFNLFSARPSFFGRDGRFSNAAGVRFGAAT